MKKRLIKFLSTVIASLLLVCMVGSVTSLAASSTLTNSKYTTFTFEITTEGGLTLGALQVDQGMAAKETTSASYNEITYMMGDASYNSNLINPDLWLVSSIRVTNLEINGNSYPLTGISTIQYPGTVVAAVCAYPNYGQLPSNSFNLVSVTAVTLSNGDLGICTPDSFTNSFNWTIS